MNREIKYRGFSINGSQWVYGSLVCVKSIAFIIPDNTTYDYTGDDDNDLSFYKWHEVFPQSVGQFTGLLDKNGITEIYEGDSVRFKTPGRSTQTHTGDNIPNGSYTEPMEPHIVTEEAEVVFKKGCFCLESDRFDSWGDEMPYQLAWVVEQGWDEAGLADAIGAPRGMWDDPDEGDKQYLIDEYGYADIAGLLSDLRGCEVIGNIYRHPHLLQS